MVHMRRYQIVTALIRPVMRLFCRVRFNVHSAIFRPTSDSRPPYLILCNHNSDLDPFFLSFCFPFPLFFVASDHLFRLGLISSLIKYLVAPIPKLKPSSDLKTVRSVITVLRGGGSVCIFPEGNRSWNGRTEPISPAIGKLAKQLRVPLLLCRIQGGYLCSPRWADHMRRGRVDCSVVRELSAADVAGMDPDKLNGLIRSELSVDAMAEQKTRRVLFHGKKLAQSIETVLFACPKCGRFATIRSSGDGAACSCGLHFRLDPLGYLIGAPYSTVSEWDGWQRGHLRKKIEEIRRRNDLTPLFRDDGQRLYGVKRAEKSELLDRGTLSLYADRLEFSGKTTHVFPLTDIPSLSARGRLVLQFSLSDGSAFEIGSDHPRSAYKYLLACGLLQQESRKEAALV